MSKEQYKPVETEEKMDRDVLKGLMLFKSVKEVEPDKAFEENLLNKILQTKEGAQRSKTNNLFGSFYKVPYAFAFAAILIVFGYIGLSVVNDKTQNNNYISKEKGAMFAHYKYLHEPTFAKSISSSIAAPNEYSLKKTLPSAEKVAKESKLSLIPQSYAGSFTYLPVYLAGRHEVTLKDAKTLAEKFNISGQPKREGFEPPGYYGFIWNTNKKYFKVNGGSGTGSFEYYLKGPGLTGKAPSDDEAIFKAKDFLTQKGIIDNNYIVSGVHYNVSDISSRSGFREDHKQVYFRKKVNSYPVYDWIAGGGSPITDRLEVWVGVDGRILYATNDGYWTRINLDSKTEYPVREPMGVFEDIKAGKGKIAWIDYDAINVSSGGYGPHAPDGNFALYGKLVNVEIEDVTLAYYHESKGIEEPEFYQPIYLFSAKATLDWKSDYNASGAEEFIRGKRTSVTLVAPALSVTSFFDNKVNVTDGAAAYLPAVPTVSYTQIPTTAPTAVDISNLTVTLSASPAEEKKSFNLKIDTEKLLDDPKRIVTLSWEKFPGAVKYNVYLKIAGDADYNTAAIAGTGQLSEKIGVNKYIDYYFKVKACVDIDKCIESNEVFLPQEQKPAFTLKLESVKPGTDPKTEVTLLWTEVPNIVKYNVYLKNSIAEDYGNAVAGLGDMSYTFAINRHNDNYFIVQACGNNGCYSSNEVFLPKL